MANRKQPNSIDVHVGSRVRLQRMISHMSQEKLGEHLGITFQQIQKYEKGINRISASKLLQIARVLSVPPAFFFEDAPGGTPEGTADGENQAASDILNFLQTAEAVSLNGAFVRIKDVKVRRKIIDLVRAVAGQEDVE